MTSFPPVTGLESRPESATSKHSTRSNSPLPNLLLLPTQLPTEPTEPTVSSLKSTELLLVLETAPPTTWAFSGFIVGVAPRLHQGPRRRRRHFQVGYSACTTALANKANYSLTVGDVVVIKGQPTGSNSFKAVNIACLSQ